MTRFYLRVDVQGGWSEAETQITTSDISLEEILEENEREIKALGYITPKERNMSQNAKNGDTFSRHVADENTRVVCSGVRFA